VKHRATASFWSNYAKLGEKTQKLADKNFELLKQNPRHTSLQFKKLDSKLWSVRIGIGYRALALPSKEGFDWFWIGSHAEYDRLI
jgi:mRNA-degrading endonuclease RelE of RelBE toxin-antitoxin system